MIQKILVPLDGSNSAEIVLPFVEEIAVKSAASIIMVTATGNEPRDLEPLFLSYLERTREKVQARLQTYSSGSAVKLDIRVLNGDTAEAILRCEEETNSDFVVMASRGSTARGPWLLGAIANRVTMASPKPVLVIKNPAEPSAVEPNKIFKKILLPLDGSTAGEAALPFTEALARQLGSEIILFHAVQPAVTWAGYSAIGSYAAIQEPEDARVKAMAYLENLRDRIAGRGLTVKAVVQNGSPAETIIDYASAEAIDAVAISTHGRSGISRWVFGSVTEKVLQYGKQAILVVHAGKV